MKSDRTLPELIEIIPDAALVVNTRGEIVLANALLHQLFGYGQGELPGKSLDDLLPESARVRHHRHMREFFTRSESRPMGRALQFLGVRADGEKFPVDIMLSMIDLDGEMFAIAFIRDATGYKLTEEKIRRELEHERTRALTDHLTGLGNRRAFTWELAQDIEELREFGWQFAVCFIDIDNFKFINDNFGHDAGDRALQEIANLIRENCRGSDFVARIGGDEIATIHPGASLESALQVLARIKEKFTDAMAAQGWPVTLSMGVCHCDDQTADYSVEKILGAADRAMYEGKQQGKNQLRIATLDPEQSGRGD